MKKMLWVLIGLLVLGSGATVYLYKTHQTKTATSTEVVAIAPDADNSEISNSDKQEQLIEVDWQKPISVTPENFFGTEKEMKAKFPAAFNADGQFVLPELDCYSGSRIMNFTNKNDDNYFYKKFFFVEKVGKVKDGVYQGKDLYVLEYSGCMDSPAVRFIDSGDGYVCLAKHSDDCFLPAIFKTDDKLYITNWATPKTIEVPNSKFILELKSDAHFSPDSDTKAKLDFTVAGNDVYFYPGAGLFRVLRPDNYFVFYSYALPFQKESGVLDIKWFDGTSNENFSYQSRAGSCGGIGFGFHYADYVSISTLKQIGTASDGSAIYELLNQNDSHLKQMYDNYVPYNVDKPTYAEFIKAKPLIFWQDFMGRFVVFDNNTFIPAAECGKPVIYLYPEKEGKVSVQVSPNGGFKLTEPEYNNGWEVMAKPNGELTNLSDGKKYPYLFWEGYAYNYMRPSEGFVVAEKQVKPFLEKVLAKLGLIKVEADEFIAFWEPKMHEQPYYFISFVPQSQFEVMAPLNVSPAPDTVIRVFMDYQGLEKPVVTMQPKIVTPIRKGFTVVEWGGAVHK